MKRIYVKPELEVVMFAPESPILGASDRIPGDNNENDNQGDFSTIHRNEGWDHKWD